MKTRILALLLGVLILLSLASCTREKHDLMYSCTGGNRTFCVRGEDEKPLQVVVKEGDDLIWAADVKVSSSVGAQNGTYGLSVADLNFDGHLDILLMQSVSGEEISYLAWLWNAERETYSTSEALSALKNITPVPERKAILAFSREKETRGGQLVQSTDSTVQYVWKSGELVPERCISLTYYAENAAWCLSAKIYNPQTDDFDTDINGTPDRWFFSAAELDAYDLSQLYYFR